MSDTMGYDLSDAADRRLISRPVVARPQTMDTLTGWAIEPTEKNRLYKAAKIDWYKAVPPKPPLANGATGRLLPLIFSALTSQGVDVKIDIEYQ
ncbi:MAG: hypothetical protein WCC36_18730, partial [Gammaproteobacteria bacterium]